MTTPVIIGDATLYCGDCRTILPSLTNLDAVVTSPPYGQQRQYKLQEFDWTQTVCGALSRVPSLDAQILVNLGLIHREGRVVRYWDALIGEMENNGWRLFGWYTWDQLSGMAGDWNGRLAPSFEFVFHFNRVAREVNKTKPTVTVGKQHSGNIRKVDGTSKAKSHDGRPVQPTKIPDSVIRVVRETSSGPDAEHPARFPTPFASELIAPFTDPGQIVCDPFMGSGTTGVACAKLGRKFIGIEIEPKYFDIACRRIEAAYAQPDMFVQSPTKPVQEAML
jgi:DNA modification methylase